MRLDLLHLEDNLIAESALSKGAATVAMLIAFGVGGKAISSMLFQKGISPKEAEQHFNDPEVHREAERMRQQIQAPEPTPEEPTVAPLTQDQEYLARILFAEAANQDRVGKEAVAQVILNRVASPLRRYPNNIQGVIAARNAFEAFPNSPLWRNSEHPEALDPIAREAYDESVEIARAATSGTMPNHIGDAILYHDTSIDKPWGEAAVETARIGDFVFYREVIIPR